MNSCSVYLFQAVKDRAASLMCRVLSSFKSAEVEAAAKELSAEEVDLLMKYVYKCFQLAAAGDADAGGSCGYLLVWHERLFQMGGHGAIVRAFTDRRRL